MMKQLGSVPTEELVAPQTAIAELAAPSEAFSFADSQILPHFLRAPLIKRAIDRVSRAAVERIDQPFRQQAADRTTRHRAAWIHVRQLDVHFAALGPIIEKTLRAAPIPAEVRVGTGLGQVVFARPPRGHSGPIHRSSVAPQNA